MSVPAFRGMDRVTALLRFAVGNPCAVEVSVAGQRAATGKGSDLFEALVAARRELERHDVLLACNGCRRDVYPSPMLRQAAFGRRAYVLTVPRTQTKPPTVDIFEHAPDVSTAVKVADQRAAFEEWLGSHGGSLPDSD